MNPDSVADEATRQALIDLQARIQTLEVQVEILTDTVQKAVETLAARLEALEG